MHYARTVQILLPQPIYTLPSPIDNMLLKRPELLIFFVLHSDPPYCMRQNILPSNTFYLCTDNFSSKLWRKAMSSDTA